MLKQFTILAIRNIFKDKVLSSINFINLIVGFSTFILISLFVESEFSWNKTNVNYERIYRVQLFMDQADNVSQHTSSITAAICRHDLQTVPEVEKTALIHDVGDNNKDGIFLSLDKKNEYKVRWGYYADPSVFEIFTFKFLEGQPQQALKDPFSIILSKKVADKLFPTGGALGKQIYGENKVAFTVTGVYEDIPKNSEWRPSFILPMNTFTPITGWKDYEDNYWAYSFNIYVLLKANAKASSVDAKIGNALQNFTKEHHPYLRPMSQLHLNPNFTKDFYYVISLLSFAALLILILSSINYINLQTARASLRLREIGIKKTVGFSKQQLYYQFIYESVLISAIAGILAIIFSQMILPIFKSLLGNNDIIGVSITSNIFSKYGLLGLVLGVTIFSGLISGLYPAYVISSFNPIKALKEKNANEKGGFGLKKILVTVQFSISLFLLIVSFIIYLQTNYMINGNLGFNTKNVVFANIVTSSKGSVESIHQRLVQHTEIKDACYSDYIPFIIPGGGDLSWENGENEEKVFVRIYNVSYNYFSTYDIPIVKGRNFSKEYPDDINKCVINETAARVFKWTDPIGKHINNWDKKIEVIGVIRDYISQSMHNPVEPHMYRLVADTIHLEGIYSVQLADRETKKGMEIVKSEFSQIFPEDAFEFTHIQTIIRDENAGKAWQVIRNISIFFAILSIIISSVGLFGLVMFYSKRKMKEIGIRKVLGFTVRDLYIKMSSEFLWLLVIATIIAWPASFYIYKFLPGAHKYPIQVWEFLWATLIIFFVAVVTISYHILKSVRTNPVEILKYE